MGQLNLERLNNVANRLCVDPEKFTTFIETGTCTGETTLFVAPYFKNIHTIEIAANHYRTAKVNFENASYSHITQYLGDSIDVLPKLLEGINEPAVFWLDGHWMGGDSGQGKKDCPLLEEIAAIDQIYQPDEAILLIDDHRLFGTYNPEDWNDVTEENVKNNFKNFKITNNYIYGEYPDDIWVLKITRQ